MRPPQSCERAGFAILCLLSSLLSLPAAEPSATAIISPFFSPPAEHAVQFGNYRSPLLFNDGARDVVPSYTQVNANFNLKPVGTKFTVGVTLTNIFNKAGIASRYSNPFGSFTTSDMYIPPRQFIGSVRYDF